jgi:hypothetical protein
MDKMVFVESLVFYFFIAFLCFFVLGSRGINMLKWLQTQANRGVLLVGFCELNGWQELESHTDLHKNRPKMVFRAANAGFAFSHVMVNTQPYNLGIVSARPFVVLGEFGPPLFQRGLLHVYFEALQLHVLVVHLHAHSSALRAEEAVSIVKVLCCCCCCCCCCWRPC